MQPSDNSTDDNIGVRAVHTSQRSPSSQLKRATSSTSAPHTSNAASRSDTGRGNAPAHLFSPSKRAKTSHPGGLRTLPSMAKPAGIVSRPGVIDLTRPSKFPTHEGPKRLVIKNLRTTSRKDIDEFYERTWDDLDAALTSNFNMEQPASPLEVLCRGVEAICKRGRGEQLSKHVKDRSKAYLETQLLPMIEKESGPSCVDTLRSVYKYWTQWNEQSVRMPTQMSRTPS